MTTPIAQGPVDVDVRQAAAEQLGSAMAALESIAACPGDNRLSTAIQWAKAAIAKCKEGK